MLYVERVAIALEVVEPFELADAVVREPVDRDRLELARPREIEERERARVVVERRGHEQAAAPLAVPYAARKPVSG